ncbi:MAG: hypothetical protein MJA83_12445 [Gammaproteobacteria bacterium]|nr:hypothetical protein [Gammaproteobacteria bacterium]
MSHGGSIQSSDLNLSPVKSADPKLDNLTLEDAERILIRNTIDRFNGNVNQAAAALGLSRSALYRRLEKYGL